MSEVLINVNEQNSAQSREATEPPTEAAVDVNTNNIEAAVKAVPEAVQTSCSGSVNENADDTGLKQDSEKSSSSPKMDGKKTPVKRTPSKRMSFIERAQRESEELVKNMGGSLEIEGGRRTRSSTRGTPTRSAVASTPPPSKKARTSPSSGASTPTRARGRGRKIETADDAAQEEETRATPNRKKIPAKEKNAATKAVVVEGEEVKEKPKETIDVEEKFEKRGRNIVDTTESNPEGDECNETLAEKKVEKPAGDDIDGVLEPVVEETQSQIAAESLPTVTKNLRNESAPVETSDEIVVAKPVESFTEKTEAKPEEVTKAVVEALQQTKEPTPEPMEVDSSSKSNDGLERMDDDVVEIIEETEVVQEPIRSVKNQQTAEEITPPNVTELNSVENIEHVKDNSVAVIAAASAAPPAGIVASNSIARSAAAIDVANANESHTKETTHDLNKTGNDLCEPKIATSPPISAANDNSSVTTPQTCN